jgi:hypothetical protein
MRNNGIQGSGNWKKKEVNLRTDSRAKTNITVVPAQAIAPWKQKAGGMKNRNKIVIIRKKSREKRKKEG